MMVNDDTCSSTIESSNKLMAIEFNEQICTVAYFII